MDKHTLRRQVQAQKKQLTKEQITACSLELTQQVLALPEYKAAKSIYSYLPYNQEIDTYPLLRQAQKDGKRVAVPKVLEQGVMAFLWLDDLTATLPGYYTIPEPVADGPEADDDRALMILPGLAFDRSGARCGYGGGFYDRYLESHPHHFKVALAYEFQLFDHLDTDAHDIPVDCVLWTPVP